MMLVAVDILCMSLYLTCMRSLDRIKAVLDTAESELRDIAKDPLSRGDYSEVTAITALAKAIAELRNSAAHPAGRNDESQSVTSAIVQPALPIEAPSRTEEPTGRTGIRHKELDKSGFPRFERHAKRLVKLGWSSKDRRVYEQRVPIETVEEICQRFAERAGSKKLLKIEKLLPMKTDEGEEIPSYQVYLVLKWLQQNSVVERQGKDGYAVGQADFDVKSLWDKTPAR